MMKKDIRKANNKRVALLLFLLDWWSCCCCARVCFCCIKESLPLAKYPLTTTTVTVTVSLISAASSEGLNKRKELEFSPQQTASNLIIFSFAEIILLLLLVQVINSIKLIGSTLQCALTSTLSLNLFFVFLLFYSVEMAVLWCSIRFRGMGEEEFFFLFLFKCGRIGEYVRMPNHSRRWDNAASTAYRRCFPFSLFLSCLCDVDWSYFSCPPSCHSEEHRLSLAFAFQFHCLKQREKQK